MNNNNNVNNEDFENQENEKYEIVEYDDTQLDFNDKIAESLEQQMKILGGAINFIKQTSKDMKELYKNMKAIEAKAEQAIERSDLAIEKLENNIFLSDGEVDELYTVVTDRSKSIAKSLDTSTYFPDDDDFGKIVGKIRMGLWSIVKRKFGASKYFKIKHIEFQQAIDFANDISTRDYVKYKNRSKKYIMN